MMLLLGTATVLLVAGAAAGARHRARTHLHRWVSPYNAQAQALRAVTRTAPTEFRPAAGLVDLRAVPKRPEAKIFDLRRERALRTRTAV
jgi:hypothetical protein